MTVIFIYGNVGSGKTIRAVYYAIRDLLRGRRILTNMKKLKLPYVVRINPMDLLRALDPDGITDEKLKRFIKAQPETAESIRVAQILNSPYPKTMILDEIGKWWDSRNHASQLNRFFAYFVDQCRKRNINLILTDQHSSGWDIRGRQLTDLLIRAVGNYYPNKIDSMGRAIPYSFEYWIFNVQRPEKGVKHVVIPAKKLEPLHPFYDTLEHIVPAEILLEKER